MEARGALAVGEAGERGVEEGGEVGWEEEEEGEEEAGRGRGGVRLGGRIRVKVETAGRRKCQLRERAEVAECRSDRLRRRSRRGSGL